MTRAKPLCTWGGCRAAQPPPPPQPPKPNLDPTKKKTNKTTGQQRRRILTLRVASITVWESSRNRYMVPVPSASYRFSRRSAERGMGAQEGTLVAHQGALVGQRPSQHEGGASTGRCRLVLLLTQVCKVYGHAGVGMKQMPRPRRPQGITTHQLFRLALVGGRRQGSGEQGRASTHHRSLKNHPPATDLMTTFAMYSSTEVHRQQQLTTKQSLACHRVGHHFAGVLDDKGVARDGVPSKHAPAVQR